MWKRFSEIEVSSWSQLLKYIITISVHINLWKQKKALRSSWSRLLNYITTISFRYDKSVTVVVADDASSSSLLLLLFAAGHNASVWAPIDCLTARNWIWLYAPLSHLVMHALMRLSFSMFHFFFGRQVSPRFSPRLIGAALSTPAFSAPPPLRHNTHQAAINGGSSCIDGHSKTTSLHHRPITSSNPENRHAGRRNGRSWPTLLSTEACVLMSESISNSDPQQVDSKEQRT